MDELRKGRIQVAKDTATKVINGLKGYAYLTLPKDSEAGFFWSTDSNNSDKLTSKEEYDRYVIEARNTSAMVRMLGRVMSFREDPKDRGVIINQQKGRSRDPVAGINLTAEVLADFLNELEYEAVHLYQLGLHTLPDPQILKLAQDEN